MQGGADNSVRMAASSTDSREKLKCESSDLNNDKEIVQFGVKPKIGYVYSEDLIEQCNRVPNLNQRVRK